VQVDDLIQAGMIICWMRQTLHERGAQFDLRIATHTRCSDELRDRLMPRGMRNDDLYRKRDQSCSNGWKGTGRIRDRQDSTSAAGLSAVAESRGAQLMAEDFHNDGEDFERYETIESAAGIRRMNVSHA
jgi:hypothetical protein